MSDYFRVLRLPDTDNDSSVQLCPKWQLQLLLAAVLKIILPMLLPSPSPLLSVSEQVCLCACVLAKESVKNTHSFFFFFFLCCCCCLILSGSGGGRSRCASLLNQGAQCVLLYSNTLTGSVVPVSPALPFCLSFFQAAAV